MKRHYAIDFDDVLCDFVPALIREVGKRQGKSIPLNSIGHWMISDILGESLDSLKKISEDSNIFHNLAPRKELLGVSRLHDAGHEITVVTNRFRVQDVEKISNEWLRRNGLPKAKLVFASKKGEVVKNIGATYFADDCLLNALDVVKCCPEVKIWLPDQPWNGENEIQRVVNSGAYTLSEIRSYFKENRIIRVNNGRLFE